MPGRQAERAIATAKVERAPEMPPARDQAGGEFVGGVDEDGRDAGMAARGAVAVKTAAGAVEWFGGVHRLPALTRAWRRATRLGTTWAVIAAALTSALGTVFDLVLPPRCPGCRAIVDRDDRFCTECFAALRFLGPPWCATCGETFTIDVGRDARCWRCVREPLAFSGARAAFAYADPVRAAVLRLKHGDETALARMMGAQIARVGGGWCAGALLVPVPLHRARLWRRGYNQAALIAAALARRVGAEVSLDALARRRATVSTAGLGRAGRFAAMAGAFALRRQALVSGRAVVLVDDVLTTGATADACARVLLDGGAADVRVLTFARVVGEGARPQEEAEETTDGPC